MKKSVLFASQTELWGTPPKLFKALNAAYDFQLDAAASKRNALCSHYFDEATDGLSQDWSTYRRVWLNPPYGRSISSWMRKAYEESQNGCLVVWLVPVRTDTRWWHEWVVGKGNVTYIRGRLRFVDQTGNASGTAPFPSAIVTYVPAVSASPDRPLPRAPERKFFQSNLCGG